MTESFLGTLKEFVLAEAQECYWQQAVLRELCAIMVPDFSGNILNGCGRGNLQEWPDWEAFNEGLGVLQGCFGFYEWDGLPFVFLFPFGESD